MRSFCFGDYQKTPPEVSNCESLFPDYVPDSPGDPYASPGHQPHDVDELPEVCFDEELTDAEWMELCS